MRLACLHLPALPLQVEVRVHPDLLGRAVAVLGSGDHPAVVACSRAAFEAGIRPGMSPGQARLRADDLAVVTGSPGRWRDEVIALAEEIGALAPGGDGRGVDLSEALDGEQVMANAVLFAEIPTGQRSERFGRQLLQLAAARGYRGRVGVAWDRFTARAAARMRDEAPVVVVARGGSAEFLAPLPLELLPLRDEVRALLRAAGVRTLGQFAALPPPSVGRPVDGVDYQGLARGNGPSELVRQPALRARRAALPARSGRGRPAEDGRQLRLAEADDGLQLRLAG
ncbi:MAG TPA: hypothetical protein VK698_03105 [Kofleriaceae bacterium]|nr:hypothetical protein [Kofleriaceae bacterium]